MVADGDLNVLRVLSGATTKIAEGEVLQLVCTSDITMTEERYIEVVKCKTAVLMAAACEAGAILGKVSAEMESALSDFGMQLGIAFQLMDDVLDYAADQSEFGKSIGHDIEEGKITLPLIHSLMGCTASERDRIGEIVSAETVEDEDFAFVFDLVHRHKGIEFTIARAQEYVERAKTSLNPFQQSTVKSALLELSDYVVTRQR